MVKEVSLIDVYAHLEELNDLSESLKEARETGVKGIIAVGMNAESNQKTLEIAQANHGYVYPALGYHPWEIREEEVEENLSFIRGHVEGCVALSEIGLDYKMRVKKELQWKVFDDLLDIANEFDKPIIIHCRYSHRRAFEMVEGKKIKKAVFHWYSGPIDLLDKILATGYFVSATPALLYSPPHQEAIKLSPLEGILLETDTPVSYRGREARPKDVRISLNEVARIKGLDPLRVSEQTAMNASRFFQISFQDIWED